MKSFAFRHGMAAPGPAPATPLIEETRTVSSVALYGHDYAGPRWKLLVEQGQEIACSAPVFCDRSHPALTIVSPCQGTVQAIELGARRAIERVVVTVDPAAETPFRKSVKTDAADKDAAILCEFLMTSGLWSALRTRPFGLVPSIDETPSAICVNACQKTGNNPDPDAMDSGERKAFARGADALALLVEQSLHIAQTAINPLYEGSHPKISAVRFKGAYCAHLASTHVHALKLSSAETKVWTIGWQDVLALGQALQTGTLSWTRKTMVGGDAANARLLTEAPIGASLRDLATGLLRKPADKAPMRVLSGDAIGGSPSSHLRRFDDCVSLQKARAGLSPVVNTETGAPLTPRNALLNALPFGAPSLPLMRALMTHDFESAQKLGAEKMVEEDVAQLTRQCGSGADYGQLLRAALDTYAGARG
ncbi:MAG: hypothetical protein AAF940_04750 [Pseudomonadota bacterium]